MSLRNWSGNSMLALWEAASSNLWLLTKKKFKGSQLLSVNPGTMKKVDGNVLKHWQTMVLQLFAVETAPVSAGRSAVAGGVEWKWQTNHGCLVEFSFSWLVLIYVSNFTLGFFSSKYVCYMRNNIRSRVYPVLHLQYDRHASITDLCVRMVQQHTQHWLHPFKWRDMSITQSKRCCTILRWMWCVWISQLYCVTSFNVSFIAARRTVRTVMVNV